MHTASTSPPLPLAGIRVVEIAQNLAGPFAGEILATLGAEVVKIERPEGDDARGWGPPFIGGAAATFQTVNRNKRSVALDLKDERALAWLKDYLLGCDILVQNLRPGAMEALGLGAEALRARNPRLIYCSLHAFGREGPKRLDPGYEPIVQAFAGMFSVNGTREGPPARVGMQVLDLGTGVWAALGCLAALLRRAQTGEGCVVDTSLFETALGWLTIHFATFGATGQQPVRDRTGNPRLIVFQAFETADGEVVVAAANDRLFAKLAIEIGREDWARDPRFRTNADRIAHRELLIPEMEAIFRTRPTAEWVRRLEAIGIPCSPINDLAAVRDDPQTAAIGALLPLPDLPELRTVGLPVSFDGVRPAHRHRAPALGADNEALGAPVPGGAKPTRP